MAIGQRGRRLIEVIVMLAAIEAVVPAARAGAGFFHVTLPALPLLGQVYLIQGVVLAACAYLWLRGERPKDFALDRPKRFWVLAGRGALAFLAIMVFDILGRPFLDPLIAQLTGTSPHLASQHFAAAKGNLALLAYLVPMGWLAGAFGEEIFYRGIVMTRLAQVLGTGRGAWIAALFIQAIPFALGHAYQGPVGMVAVYVVALIYGAASLAWGRSLWPAIIAHGLQDTFGFVMLYAGLAGN